MKTLMTLISFCFITQHSFAQQVSTITTGRFHDGMEIDSLGRVYCSDYSGTKVYRYNPQNSQVSEFATGLVTPNGIGMSPDNKIYVCEATANRITVYDTTGNQIDQITGLNNPTGIKYHAQTNSFLLVSYNASALLRLDPVTHTTTPIVSGSPLSGPSGIAFINGDIYISNFNNRKIFKLAGGSQLNEIAQLPSGAGQSNFCGFLTAKGKYLYATQIGQNRIYKVDPDSSTVSLFAGSNKGGNDGSLDSATFDGPNGIVADPKTDHIYISEANSRNLRIISNVSIGLQEYNAQHFELYPIPAKESVQLVFNKPLDIESIEILDINGRRVQGQTYKITSNTLDISKLKKGTYIIQVKAEKISYSRQFIKQ